MLPSPLSVWRREPLTANVAALSREPFNWFVLGGTFVVSVWKGKKRCVCVGGVCVRVCVSVCECLGARTWVLKPMNEQNKNWDKRKLLIISMTRRSLLIINRLYVLSVCVCVSEHTHTHTVLMRQHVVCTVVFFFYSLKVYSLRSMSVCLPGELLITC